MLPNVERERLWCQHLYKELDDTRSEKIQPCDKWKGVEDEISNFKDTKSKNYEKLRRDVTKLEYEVQSFLDSLRSGRLKINSMY